MPKSSKAKSSTAKQQATPCNIVQQEATSACKPKRETKQSIIIDLLARAEGATLAEIITATEWKSHSVRGHLSNLRKKQGMNIESFTNKDGQKGYRILG